MFERMVRAASSEATPEAAFERSWAVAVLDAALACARRIATLPRGAVEDTKRVINLHLERAVLATIDYALTAEHRSFDSPELRANLDLALHKD